MKQFRKGRPGICMAAIGGGPSKPLFMYRESFGEGELIENQQEWGGGVLRGCH